MPRYSLHAPCGSAAFSTRRGPTARPATINEKSALSQSAFEVSQLLHVHIHKTTRAGVASLCSMNAAHGHAKQGGGEGEGPRSAGGAENATRTCEVMEREGKPRRVRPHVPHSLSPPRPRESVFCGRRGARATENPALSRPPQPWAQRTHQRRGRHRPCHPCHPCHPYRACHSRQACHRRHHPCSGTSWS